MTFLTQRKRPPLFLIAWFALIAAFASSAETWDCGADSDGGGDSSVKAVLSGGTLTVSGKGDMAGYSFLEAFRDLREPPWNEVSSSITAIVIKPGVTSIGDEAFAGCAAASVNIPNSVTSIGRWAFSGCPLKSVAIPKGVAIIGDDPFGSAVITVDAGNANFSAVDNVLFNKGKTTIVQYNKGNKSGASYTIPGGVMKIGRRAFFRCGLASVIIPNGVAVIEEEAFLESGELTSVTIPNSVASIEPNAFSGCKLSSITIPDGWASIGESAFSGSGLASVTIPSSVKSIGSFAFSGCELKSVAIPNSVTSIGNGAFSGCGSLKSVTIGGGVTSIGDLAFANCGGLAAITALPPTPPAVVLNVFRSVSRKNTVLSVPKASLAAYKSANIWKGFKRIKST